jgi:lipoprotein-anchoring transpeptidase ErfK/SrfK
VYYSTTYWVTGLQVDAAGGSWYTILDDKRKRNYFVNAAHLRLIPDEALTPLSPQIPIEGKRLEIRLAEQVIVAYEWDEAVFMSRIATGARFRNGNFTTPTGRFMTYHKRPTRHMAAGDYAAPNSYDLPGVPWVCYFTPEGISIHGTYWHNDYGLPRSHGCINLTPAAAHWVYRWTMPVVEPYEIYAYKNFGTTIDIID